MIDITYDKSGKCIAGLFYELSGATQDPSPMRDARKWKNTVASSPLADPTLLQRRADEDGLYVQVGVEDRTDEYLCPVSQSHPTGQTNQQIYVVMFGRGPLYEFLPLDHTGPLVTNEFATRLRGRHITGLKLTTVPVLESDSRYPKTVCRLSGKTALWERPLRLRDGLKNQCPLCGHSPLICPGCGFRDNPCGNCKGLAITGIKMSGEKPPLLAEATPVEGPILNGSTWSGDDACRWGGALIVTRRVVDWLVSLHVGPFIALPIQVWTDGMSKQQREWLERAKTPLPD